VIEGKSRTAASGNAVYPPESTPRRLNQFWHSEFMHVCPLVGVEPYIAPNVGSGTPKRIPLILKRIANIWLALNGSATADKERRFQRLIEIVGELKRLTDWNSPD
jgi:alpha-L-arabinofuranosidase